MKHRTNSDKGVALIVVLLAMLIFTGMMLGFYFVTTGEQKIAASDRDSTVAYYGAVGALEKMSSDLAAFFVSYTSPSPSQITALTGPTYVPSIPGVSFPAAGGYTIGQPPSGIMGGTLTSSAGTIGGNGPLQGLQGILTPFTLTVIADGPNNTEVKMTRQVQEVAVPVFQFGIFSDTDLSFFAGPNFGFGGRVGTNGNLFLAEGPGNNLTINDKVTVYKDIVRAQLSNGFGTAAGSGYEGEVDVLNTSGGCNGAPPPPGGTCRALGLAEGSVVAGPGSGPTLLPIPWTTISLTTYNGEIRNGKTGIKKLNLALALAGASPIAMIQRPITVPPGPYEDPASSIGHDRFFNQASLRVLLSDSTAAIMNLPAIDSSVQPFPLDDTLIHNAPFNLPAADSCHPPLAKSPGWAADNDYMSPLGTKLLGGFIKIEIQLNSAPGTWKDVTAEVLKLGISRDVASGGMAAPTLATSNGGSLAASTTYYYVVTALGPWGETPGAEASRSTSSTKKTITETWTAFAGATGYRVYRGTSSGGETGYISVGSGSTSYTDNGGTGLTAGSLPIPCTNISVLHLEEAGPGVTLTPSNVTVPSSFVPINIYDTREGEVRDISGPTTVSLNGVMNLVEVDVKNLQSWFNNTLCTASTIPISCPNGALALNNDGYILYTSDRRGNNNGGSETGEYGNEDIINPSSGTGAPNGTLDAPEDVNADGIFRTYGATPRPIAVDNSGGTKYPQAGSPTTLQTFMPAAVTPLDPSKASTRITSSEGQKNSVVFFRRALRLVNGSLGNLPPLPEAHCTSITPGGFTVASENPIYVQGDYNASVANTFNDTAIPPTAGLCHVPAAIIGDAVTLLSNNWAPGAQPGNGDANSFASPTSTAGRVATGDAYYRMAIISGKNNSFTLPTFTVPQAPNKDFGTDGGTHNFLRYIEDWSAVTLHYRGSMVSFYIGRQATGVYKCCNTVYSPPSTRDYAFDTDFTNIQKLPPGTPRFTDVNALSYQQSILSTQ